MKIQCILMREGGTRAEIGGLEYHFEPLADGAHVAEVEDKSHRDRFLAIPEAYKIYDGELEPKGKPVVIKAAVVNDKEDIRSGANRTQQNPVLIGSDAFEATYEIGGALYQLGDVVAAAHTNSGLTVDEWNALDAEDRDARIEVELDKLADAAEAASAQKPAEGTDEAAKAAELEALVAQYKAKFGQAPHWRTARDAEKLKEALAK